VRCKTNALLVTLLIAFASQVVSADGLSPGRLEEIANYHYAGVDFSTTRRAFLARFPGAIARDEASATIGVSDYALPGDDKVDEIRVGFLDDRLFSIGLYYREERIEQYYGIDALMRYATKQFGTPESVHGRNAWWRFSEIDRTVSTYWDGKYWSLTISRPSFAEELAKRK
jgi:hypothetical protein